MDEYKGGPTEALFSTFESREAPRAPRLVCTEALFSTFEQCGAEILKNPEMLRNALKDLAELDTPEEKNFLSACSVKLLNPYWLAYKNEAAPVKERLIEASRKAVSYLSDECRFDEGESYTIALMIANALGRYISETNDAPYRCLTYNDLEKNSATQENYRNEVESNIKKRVPILLGICAASIAILVGFYFIHSSISPSLVITLHSSTSPEDDQTTQINTRQNAKVELPTDVFTQEGYQIAGWMAQRDGDPESGMIEVGYSVLVTDSADYYAVWVPLAYYDGNGAESGTCNPTPASISGQLILPDNPFQRAGCKFGGWSAEGEDLYSAGDTTTISKPTTFRAQWCAEISFDGNGATGGATDSIYCDSPGKAVLPKCGYVKEGYEFSGWSTKEGYESYLPGDTIESQYEPLTLYAVWKTDSSVVDAMHVEKTERKASDGSRTLFLLVRNDSSRTVNLTLNARFDSYDVDDVEWQDRAWCFAPSDEALFVCPDDTRNGGSGNGEFSYTIEAQPPQEGTMTLKGKYSIEEVGVSQGQQVTIKVTNTSQDTLHLQHARIYAVQPGYGTDGGFAFYYGDIDKDTLAPGESTYAAFGNTNDGVQWNDLHREYYLYGYAD